MVGTKGHSGGARKGSGKPRSHLFLNKEDTRKLAIIVRHKRAVNSGIDANRVVSQLIDECWQGLDALYQNKQEEVE